MVQRAGQGTRQQYPAATPRSGGRRRRGPRFDWAPGTRRHHVMWVYRLIKQKYADDPLDPQGAKLLGGCWFCLGFFVVFVSDSFAFAALEMVVHLHRSDILNRFVLCKILLADEAIMTLAMDTLPPDWREDPPPSSTIAIGDEWLSSGESLALAVPSTIVPQQFNLIINPKHPDFGTLRDSVVIERFIFDARLAK